MKLRDLSIGAIIVLATLAAIGIGTRMITKEADHPIEELAEEHINDIIESSLGLPDDVIDIDLSPASPEESLPMDFSLYMDMIPNSYMPQGTKSLFRS